jgi:uncharacterized protein YdaU (DUF1376 family)
VNRYPYIPLYVNDFVTDEHVDDMSTLALGAYWRLIFKAWHQTPVGSIPNDDDKLAQWSRLSHEDWEKVRKSVLAAWELGDDNKFHQKRLEREFKKLKRNSKVRSSAGSKGAETRWGKRKRIAKLKQSHGDATPEPMAKNSLSSSISSSSSSPPSPPGGTGGANARNAAQATPRNGHAARTEPQTVIHDF